MRSGLFQTQESACGNATLVEQINLTPDYMGTIRHRVASGDCSPKAPADLDERDYRTRLFGARLRYVTGREMCGWGSG